MALPTRVQQSGLLILALLIVLYWLARHVLKF
jgi:hypothetical protein